MDALVNAITTTIVISQSAPTVERVPSRLLRLRRRRFLAQYHRGASSICLAEWVSRFQADHPSVHKRFKECMGTLAAQAYVQAFHHRTHNRDLLQRRPNIKTQTTVVMELDQGRRPVPLMESATVAMLLPKKSYTTRFPSTTSRLRPRSSDDPNRNKVEFNHVDDQAGHSCLLGLGPAPSPSSHPHTLGGTFSEWSARRPNLYKGPSSAAIGYRTSSFSTGHSAYVIACTPPSTTAGLSTSVLVGPRTSVLAGSMTHASVGPPISVPAGHLAFVPAGPSYSIAVENLEGKEEENDRDNKEDKAEDVSREIEFLSTLNPATLVAVYGRDGVPAEQLVTDFENVIVLDADGVANTVVHVDVARTLIELKSDVKSLIEMVFNLEITARASLDQKAGNQPSVNAAALFDFDLPVETNEALCELETNLHNNPALATELKALLSLV
ncbi:hypothetical protein DAPPUDRAFT_255265 [Daphnia pulex]|uniref:Uncharacterized protein n=1 Tax=Daphnia pulex TaxID=6669 RepID=E9H8W0_DAPPU|nr:hypothetical protein DAPPUDRAFT_255265 [Daphnia pulex]|eukprot:EFX71825.1 hypothetical protein DAPPUDRAFT_255265 [Daphnia pulex]